MRKGWGSKTLELFEAEETVLEYTGLDQTWKSQNKFMLSFKESIVRIFTQRWRKDIESSSKLRTYALVKKYFCVEPYILHIRGNHLITAMAKNIRRGHSMPVPLIFSSICCNNYKIKGESWHHFSQLQEI